MECRCFGADIFLLEPANYREKKLKCIEPLLIIAMVALDFAVASQGPWAECLMHDVVSTAKQIRRMHKLRLRSMAKHSFTTPPFYGYIVLSEVLRLLFRRFRLSAVSEPREDAVQRARVPAVRLFLAQFPVHFAYTDVRISPMKIANPTLLFQRVRIRVRSFRTMRLRLQRFPRSVVQPVPPHQRRLRDVIPPADELHILHLPI